MTPEEFQHRLTAVEHRLDSIGALYEAQKHIEQLQRQVTRLTEIAEAHHPGSTTTD